MLGVISLGQYTSQNPWNEFLLDTDQRYGNTSPYNLQVRLKGEYDRWLSQINKDIILLNKIPEFAGRSEFQLEAIDLKEELESFKGAIANYGLDVFNDSQRRNIFIDVNSIILDIQKLGYAIWDVSDGVSVIDEDAGQIARQAKEEMTPIELAEIRDIAGDDQVYFDALYQSLFAKKLAEQYSSILPDGVMDYLEDQTQRNDALIKDLEPTPSAFRDPDSAVNQILDFYEKEGNPFLNPSWIPSWLKWTVGIGVSVYALSAAAKIAQFGTAYVKRTKRKKNKKR